MNYIYGFLKGAYDYVYPAPVEIENITVEKINDKIPHTLHENGVVNFQTQNVNWLTYRQPEKAKNWQIQKACDTILDKEIQCVFFPLATKTLRFSTKTRGDVEKPISIISKMLANDRCKVQYLDLSKARLEASELTELLQSLPPKSVLKCIYIGTNEWRRSDFLKLVEFLQSQSNQLKTLILGVHNLEILYEEAPTKWSGKSLAELSKTDSEIALASQALDDFNKQISPHIDLDAKSIYDSEAEDKLGATYH